MDSLAREKGRTDRSNNPFSICIFDLDHFKLLNDDYGHLAGDRILRGFAKRVRGELRTMDAVNRSEHRRSFGRFGGEEFIAILPATNLEGGARAAERIRKSVHDRVFDDAYKVTVSVGVAEYKRGETVSQLLKRADQALYQAKDNGRDRVCVSELKKSRAKKARVMDLGARIQK
jgi:diguanylate cyclase (GGDEF)-like protein